MVGFMLEYISPCIDSTDTRDMAEPHDNNSSCDSLEHSDSEEVKIREHLRLVIKNRGYSSKKNPRVELRLGTEWSEGKQKWINIERLIDKNQDQYREVVSDPETGEIIHQCEEPLSKHYGHGSAKFTPPPDDKSS